MAQVIEQALAAHERIRKSTELPLFYGQKEKDTITPHDFIQRFETASQIANWVPAPAAGAQPNYARKCQEFYMLLRGEALEWYRALGRLNDFDYDNWDALRIEFLASHAPRYTSRSACLSFTDLVQRQGESVKTYHLRVAKVHHLLEEIRPPAIAQVRMAAPNIDIDALPARQAALQAAMLAAKAEGVVDMGRYFATQLFTAGLQEDIRVKTMEIQPANFDEAYKRALTIETILKDKRGAKPLITSIEGEETEEDDIDPDDEDEELMSAVNAMRKARGKGPIRFANRKPNGQFKSKLTINCRYCKKNGHFQRDCHKRKRENGAMVDANGKPYKMNPIEEDEGNQDEQEDEEEQAVQTISNFYGINCVTIDTDDEEAEETERRQTWLQEVGEGNPDTSSTPEETGGYSNHALTYDSDDPYAGYSSTERVSPDPDTFQGYLGGDRLSLFDCWDTPPIPRIYHYYHEYNHDSTQPNLSYRYLDGEYVCSCMFRISNLLSDNPVDTTKPIFSGDPYPYTPKTSECFCGLDLLFQLPSSYSQEVEEEWHLACLFGDEEYPTYENWMKDRKDREWPKRSRDTVMWYEYHPHLLCSKTRTALRAARLNPDKGICEAILPNPEVDDQESPSPTEEEEFDFEDFAIIHQLN